MSSGLQLSAFFIFGVLLGGCYFGGLWWTVRQLPQTRHIWRLYFGSLVLRLALLLTSFYYLLTCFDWLAVTACLLGVLTSRFALMRMLGPERSGLPTQKGLR